MYVYIHIHTYIYKYVCVCVSILYIYLTPCSMCRYPLLKGPLAKHNLIIQVDGPFANAGVFYVQNVQPGDGAAWVLEELNRRIQRFTYRPESVRC